VDWLFRLLVPDCLFDLFLRAAGRLYGAGYAWYATEGADP